MPSMKKNSAFGNQHDSLPLLQSFWRGEQSGWEEPGACSLGAVSEVDSVIPVSAVTTFSGLRIATASWVRAVLFQVWCSNCHRPAPGPQGHLQLCVGEGQKFRTGVQRKRNNEGPLRAPEPFQVAGPIVPVPA